ncbi:MAG: hypothetical protein WBH97_08880 [Rectinemataceae bacterium]
MLIQFTLQELMVFLLCAVGILAGAILIPVLLHLKKMVGILRPLVENNQESIKKSFKTMPLILGDFEQIGSNVRDTTDKLKITLPAVVQEVECVANAAKGSFASVGDVMEKMSSGINESLSTEKKDNTGYFHLFEELLQLIYRSLSSGK